MDQLTQQWLGRCCHSVRVGQGFSLRLTRAASRGFWVLCGHLFNAVPTPKDIWEPLGRPRQSPRVACMTMLRAVACDAGVFWFTDSEYAHGVVIAGSTAQSELTLVQRARCEAGWRRRFALLHGRTYPGHIRFPPKMKQPDLCPAVPTLSLDHALYWTQIDTILDPLNYSTVHSNAKSRDIVHLHVATANVLTLYRLDRAYESMEASLHIIGIQEPRERDPFPWNVADYVVFASRATDRGAGGCELWIRKAQISDLKECQVLLAQPRRLLVKLSCCFGVLRCVVLHGLDGSS